MKTKFILFALPVIIAIILISQNYSNQIVGPHGGRLKQAENYNIEMKNPYGEFYTYLLDKNLVPISNKSKGISCEVNFFILDNMVSDFILEPKGEDAFFTKITMPYHSCRITFHVFGKKVSAKFESETLIVQKK